MTTEPNETTHAPAARRSPPVLRETHAPRVRRLRRAGVDVESDFTRIYVDVRGQFDDRRDEVLARHEAMIVELERQHADALATLDRRERTEQRAARIEKLDLPITVSDAGLLARDALAETRALKAIRAWHPSEAPLLVLSGSTGRGKTLAAAFALLEHGGRYVRAPELARLYLAQFGAEVEQRDRLAAEPQLLVCDDIGVERNADAMTTALVELLDARRRGMRTIWATNLDRRAFEERYSDARLLSRMAQSARWLVDAGDDLRRGQGSGEVLQ